MITDRDITSFFHAKSSVLVLALLACLSSVLAWDYSAVVPIVGNLGFGLPSANLWLPFNLTSAGINLCLNLGVALLTVYINRAFNVLRSLTSLVATMFLAMQIASPSVLGQFYGGTLLAIVAMLGIMLLFSVFTDPVGQRRVFLIFFLLGGAAFTQVAYLFYVPVFMLGCVQMRVFTFRTFLAALLGLITPPWILFGFGIVGPGEMRWPGMVVAWSLFDEADKLQALVTVGFTLLVGTVFTVANILKILSYNSRVRAFNGFLTMLLIFTAIFILVNFNDFTFYIPLLNCLVAYQVGHFFTYRRHRRSYVPILLLVLAYGALYVWALSA